MLLRWDGDEPSWSEIPLAELQGLTAEAEHFWPDLAPNGGRFWTQEDCDAAISMLVAAMNARGFQKAMRSGMTVPKRKAYLRRALHNALLHEAAQVRQIHLLDTMVLDARPCEGSESTPLSEDEADAIAIEIRCRLTLGQEVLLRTECRRICSRTGGRGPRGACWMSACALIQSLVLKEDLRPADQIAVMKSLLFRILGD